MLRYCTRDLHYNFFDKLSKLNFSGRAKLIHVFRIETDEKEMQWASVAKPTSRDSAYKE
jgi:hypothetical protein